MSQVITSLNAVTSDTTGTVFEFTTLKTHYAMHYMATIPSGLATLTLEGSLDGTNYFGIVGIQLSADANEITGGALPVLFLRARVTGLASGRTVTALLAVVD